MQMAATISIWFGLETALQDGFNLISLKPIGRISNVITYK